MSRYINIVGQRFGRLVVTEYKGNDSRSCARWLCQCDCGNQKEISANSLRQGLTKSCGCLNNEILKKGLNAKGKRTGKALENILKGVAKRARMPTPHAAIKFNTGRRMSDERKRAISERAKSRGKNHNFYKDGSSEDRVKKGSRQYICQTIEYKLWRADVLTRDNNTCQDCGVKLEKGLHVHHIQSWNEYPDLRYAVDNGKTLCPECHRKIPHSRKKRD